MILTKRSAWLRFSRLLSDITVVTVSWALAFVIRFQVQVVAITKGPDTFAHYFRLWPLLIFCYIFVFISMGVYKNSFENKKSWDENFNLIQKHVISFLIFVTLSYFIYEHRYSRVTTLIFFFLVPILLPFGRSLMRKIHHLYYQNKKYKHKVLIIGSGKAASSILKSIKKHKDWNMEVAHFLPFSAQNEINSHLEQRSTEVVFIAPAAHETHLVNEIYKHLDKSLAEVFLLPYLGEHVYLAPKPLDIDGWSAVAINASGLDPQGQFLKRSFDIIFSFLFILCFSPVFLICALLVRLSSPGPIFYKQERMGLDGKKFACYKFRGMYQNAESHSGPVWAKANDDRTTAVGKWLRKTSLDELPQFFNVLQGHMSVVGPRPERPFFVEEFKNQIPGYMLRHKSKAGITGWAQIQGWRGNTSLEKRIACDLWYIQNWSFWLDLKIILLTPFKGLVHPNAY